MLPSLVLTWVSASVRPDGAVGPYAPRRFQLMLGAGDDLDAQQREALRVIRQLGWQPRGRVSVGPRDLRQEAA